MIVSVHPFFGLNASPDTAPRFRIKDLLHPKAGGGAVEQADQGQVIALRRLRRQLDDRRGLLEHLPAPVEDEVVVGGDEGEGY